jgi:hypothetical protein
MSQSYVGWRIEEVITITSACDVMGGGPCSRRSKLGLTRATPVVCSEPPGLDQVRGTGHRGDLVLGDRDVLTDSPEDLKDIKRLVDYDRWRDDLLCSAITIFPEYRGVVEDR